MSTVSAMRTNAVMMGEESGCPSPMRDDGDGRVDVFGGGKRPSPSSHIVTTVTKGVQRERLPPAERNALLMRSVKSAFALLLARVTEPIYGRN